MQKGGAERHSVTNGLRQIDCHLSNDVGRLGNEQEATHKEVHQAAMTAVAVDKGPVQHLRARVATVSPRSMV